MTLPMRTTVPLPTTRSLIAIRSASARLTRLYGLLRTLQALVSVNHTLNDGPMRDLSQYDQALGDLTQMLEAEGTCLTIESCQLYIRTHAVADAQLVEDAQPRGSISRPRPRPRYEGKFALVRGALPRLPYDRAGRRTRFTQGEIEAAAAQHAGVRPRYEQRSRIANQLGIPHDRLGYFLTRHHVVLQ